VFALTLGGCSGGSVTAPTAPATPSPPTAQYPAPHELQGAWVTVLYDGEQVTLTLSESYYGITRGPNHASGAIAVHGDRIEFSQSSLCIGTGGYRWSLTQDSLLFTNVLSDQCGGRREVLDGQTYKRSG
jgi:hypothetical protein